MGAEDRRGKTVDRFGGFVGNGCNFEFNPLSDWEPVKFCKNRSEKYDGNV